MKRLRALACVLVLLAPWCAAVAASPGAEGPKLVFCCSSANDLFQVSVENGFRSSRFDRPLEAVEAAPEEGAVLILAEGYPQKTTKIDAAVFDLVKKKRLRLYVEYPESLPGVEVGPPRRALVERAVVSSAFFGPDLARLRILAMGGLHFVPVSVENAHVVAARVAGFDTAVYGLPETTHPILFEHPGGGVLVATAKLSHFVTGRYAPTDAWRALWKGVFAWLCPVETIPELSWTPTVRPRYGPEEPLPADA